MVNMTSILDAAACEGQRRRSFVANRAGRLRMNQWHCCERKHRCCEPKDEKPRRGEGALRAILRTEGEGRFHGCLISKVAEGLSYPKR